MRIHALATLIALTLGAAVQAQGVGPAQAQAIDAAVLDYIAARPAAQRIGLVNAAVNRFEHRADAQAGIADEWLAPAQLRERGYGDCEDFAIAKFAALRALGIPDDRLRLAYGRLRTGGAAEAHMVALVDDGSGRLLVLDSLSDTVLPLAERADLHIVFSFNRDTTWEGASLRRVQPRQPLRRWVAIAGQL